MVAFLIVDFDEGDYTFSAKLIRIGESGTKSFGRIVCAIPRVDHFAFLRIQHDMDDGSKLARKRLRNFGKSKGPSVVRTLRFPWLRLVLPSRNQGRNHRKFRCQISRGKVAVLSRES